MNSGRFPLYFSSNDRPVKVVVKKYDDGYEIIPLGLNLSSGDWESAEDDYDRYLRRNGDIDSLTEAEFKAMVSKIRKELGVPDFD